MSSKKYKADWFQKNKKKIYAKRKSSPISKLLRQHYYIKSRYGISGKEYGDMVALRQGKCDICNYVEPLKAERKEKLYIDHDHVTKKVRGLLCFSCNTALGHFKDNPESLAKAIIYLSNGKKTRISSKNLGSSSAYKRRQP